MKVAKAIEQDPSGSLDFGDRVLWAPFTEDLPPRFYGWENDIYREIATHPAQWVAFRESLPFETTLGANVWSYRALFVAIVECVRWFDGLSEIEVFGADMEGRENFRGQVTQGVGHAWDVEIRRYDRIAKTIRDECGVKVERKLPA